MAKTTHKRTALMLMAALITGAAGGYHLAAPRPAPAGEEGGISVYFSPSGGCTAAAVSVIAHAQVSIDLQAYSFTSQPIAQALVGAAKRGVKVRAIIDDKAASDHGSQASRLAYQGIPTYVDAQHAIAHNKIMIIDGQTILTGSFNFTRAAEEHNAENLLLIEQKPALCQAYARNFETHLAHSSPYK